MQWLNKIFAVFGKIGKDRYMHFAFGSVIAAVAIVATCWVAVWLSLVVSLVAVVAAALVKDLAIDDMADYIDILCTIGGGVAVWLPAILVGYV
jgi:hypothetical protein